MEINKTIDHSGRLEVRIKLIVNIHYEFLKDLKTEIENIQDYYEGKALNDKGTYILENYKKLYVFKEK